VITINAKNEVEVVEQLFNSDIDLGVFYQAAFDKLGCVASAAQAKAIIKEAADRSRKRAQIEEWREAGELYTYESFPEEFVKAIKAVYKVNLKSWIENSVKTRPCFIEYLGTVYFPRIGYESILNDLQFERSRREWESVRDLL